MDDIVVEILKNWGISIIDWLLRIFNRCIGGKGCRRDCAYYRGISILNIPGKIYGSLLISRVIAIRKNM